MKTEQLYEFLVLSRTLNYSRAADALYISQSVLSRHILEMEQELNTSLFFRTTHNVSLTPAGHLLARKAESLLDKCNAAVHLARTGSLPSKGRVRIACAPEIACSPRLQAFVRYFSERYPDIYVHFEVKSEGTPESVLENPALLPANTQISPPAPASFCLSAMTPMPPFPPATACSQSLRFICGSLPAKRFSSLLPMSCSAPMPKTGCWFKSTPTKPQPAFRFQTLPPHCFLSPSKRALQLSPAMPAPWLPGKFIFPESPTKYAVSMNMFIIWKGRKAQPPDSFLKSCSFLSSPVKTVLRRIKFPLSPFSHHK